MATPPLPSGAPILILLVEDDDAHAEIVKRNLLDARVANEIVHVRDGQAALDYLRIDSAPPSADVGPRPDLIMLDLRLPKVDGLEVLRRIRASPDVHAIPVVVLTTSAAERDLVAAYEGGAGSYLVKPVDYAQFTTLMATFGFYWLAWNQYPIRQRND